MSSPYIEPEKDGEIEAKPEDEAKPVDIIKEVSLTDPAKEILVAIKPVLTVKDAEDNAKVLASAEVERQKVWARPALKATRDADRANRIRAVTMK